MSRASMRLGAKAILAEARAEYPGQDLAEVLDALIDAIPDISPQDRKDLIDAIWELN